MMKKTTSFYIDNELIKKLRLEDNQSALINELLEDYYKKKDENTF